MANRSDLRVRVGRGMISLWLAHNAVTSWRPDHFRDDTLWR